MNTKIAEIGNKAACPAWCPVKEYSGLVALGSKDSGGGVGFDSTGGELDLYTISITGEEPKLEGHVKTAARFASVAWTPYTGSQGQYPAGILAGGMADGTVLLFDPAAIMSRKEAVLGTVPAQPSSGPIASMQFSTLDTFNLCAGAYNGIVSILNCTDPKNPARSEPGSPGSSAEVTAVAWNTAVAHIVATAAGDGTVTVWDVNTSKPWCEIRAEHAGQAVADIAWNPAQGLHLLTASSDDRNPVLKVWDLGASTSVPLATLSGHSAGLFRVSWCPHDDSLLVSVAKDNRTLLWDLHTLAAVAELPIDVPEQQQHHQQANSSAGALFASGRPGLQEQKQLRYDIKWSPFQRGVALTCSLDKKVQIHSLLALATCAGRPPAWMKPASCVSTGFGGMVISCGTGETGSIVTIQTVQEKPKLAEISQTHEAELTYQQNNIIDFCKTQQERVDALEDKALWGFMQVVFETNARQELLLHLGFDYEEIAASAGRFSDDLTNGVSNMSLKDEKVNVGMSEDAQEIVKRALLVGNFEAAVECCFQSGSYADALMLASCGGAELWAKAQERFFESESPKRPYLSLMSGIVRNELEEMVAKSDTSTWQETLAVLATYAQSEEFPVLCVSLGDRLHEAGDKSSASLCYMCALNLERSVMYWHRQLEERVSDDFSTEADLIALHEFVVKVSVFVMAAGSTATLTPEIEDLYSKYCMALVEQGLLVTASKYCTGSSDAIQILRDRLYRSRSSQQCYAVLGAAPQFPYTMVDVQQSRGQVLAQPRVQQNVSDDTQQYAQEQTQHNYDQQHSYGQQNYENQGNYGQQSYDQQQGYTQNQYGQQAGGQTGTGDQLPPGWMALQDPNTGNTYYANQNTGETTWDRPQSTQSSQPAYQQTEPNLDSSQRSVATQSTASKTGSKNLVSKYGDGFVSSASNPELAYQYGNVGTSNPYGGSARPGTAAAVGGTQQKPPVSGTLNFDSLELSNHHHSIKDNLLGLADALKGAPLNPVEKRQLSEAEKAIAILVKKMARDGLHNETIEQVSALVSSVTLNDYGTALAIQTALANSEWRDHKDWLKGIKVLLQLAQKKFQR